ncbi:MAG TPA: BON domain-containing protein [Thermoanaerobaculia bacterium]|nr:BON domain-containing protein [Thermoanaerobaculia bacterium]
MIRIAPRSLILAFLCLLIPSAVYSQAEAVDLTDVFVAGGIEIDRLMVYKVSDIVLIRGRTSDVAAAAEAGRFAESLGYRRVANLIVIVPALDDRAIERLAARELDMARGLEGCHFQITSLKGVLRLRGEVRRQVQKDVAIGLLRKIDGVKAVHLD